jgi:hypothetical protein
VSWPDAYDEPDGTCESCGLDLDDDPRGDHDDHHRLCWACWRGDDGPVDLPVAEVCPRCLDRRVLLPVEGRRPQRLCITCLRENRP